MPYDLLLVALRRKAWFEAQRIDPKQADPERHWYGQNHQNAVLAHCHWITDQILDIAQGAGPEQVRDWLAFVDGCLFAAGALSLSELQDYSSCLPTAALERIA